MYWKHGYAFDPRKVSTSTNIYRSTDSDGASREEIGFSTSCGFHALGTPFVLESLGVQCCRTAYAYFLIQDLEFSAFWVLGFWVRRLGNTKTLALRRFVSISKDSV